MIGKEDKRKRSPVVKEGEETKESRRTKEENIGGDSQDGLDKDRDKGEGAKMEITRDLKLITATSVEG